MISKKEKEELKASAASITSGTTAVSTAENSPFIAGKSLFINTRGIPLLRLPLPPSELEIDVSSADGSLAFRSIREKRCSGSCVLSDASQNNLISTTYFWGPSRDPVLQLLGPTTDPNANTIKTISKWTSCSHKFVMPDGRVFEWAYKRERQAGGKKMKVLMLYRRDDSIEGGKSVARLVRNEDTRTPGSSKSSAGNGGELVLSENAAEVMDEAIIVATCILMLKKEIDRMRTVQAMML
ncbi:hypothetical protein AOQ84DRAFT_302429 [Glonium stellatum]|uniref:Uncharacterized protein n=1 Tax=Glonium stellatum TaxID=574774 RepID=A0A8E2JNK6_9PEZI|nr:hypothetical protein AOQ84DRAFT_302429 [Glonium stellatum]